VIVSVPTFRNPGERLKVTVPLLRLFVAVVFVPAVRATEPVGVPLEPVTVTVTAVPLRFEKLVGLAETETVAVAVPTADAHPFTTFATFNVPSPVARSKPTPAPYPERMPTASPECETVQFGDPEAHGIAIVPVTTSLK
jgi:hypothetical protein